jgi:hypothetical protein
MKTDAVVFGALVLSFALLVTAHLGIAVGLATRPRRWRSFVALVIAPLAPYFALRDGMYVRGAVWIVAGAAHLVVLAVAV